MKSNIILIGFMGCGKTSVGKALSETLTMPMIDTDQWIEQKQAMTVSQIFKQRGESAFRKMETECISELIETIEHQIISVGGGLPVTAGNAKLLKQLGKVIYLKATAETIFERLKADSTRPLLQVEDPKGRIETLLQERESKYLACADITIDGSDKTVQEITNQIIWNLNAE